MSRVQCPSLVGRDARARSGLAPVSGCLEEGQVDSPDIREPAVVVVEVVHRTCDVQ